MNHFIIVISLYTVSATNNDLRRKDSRIEEDLVSENNNPLHQYRESNDTCSDKIRATCRDQDGTCVPLPFDVNCGKGRIKTQGCKSMYCACCLPELSRACATKMKHECTHHYGTCVVAPFKQNCKDGTLEKKWCKSKYCQCCVPDVAPAHPTGACPPSPPPVTCPPSPPTVTCPTTVTCPSPSPPLNCPPTPSPLTCPPSTPTSTYPQAIESEICPIIPKSFIDWKNCTVLLDSPTEQITELNESYYLSHGFVFQNVHLILKPKLGEYSNWRDSIKRCQDLNSEPFIPESQEDWDMLQEISRNISDTKKYNMWLPASDIGTEGLLKWLPVNNANDDSLIPWNQCTKMKTNSKVKDCLQLWSGNGYKATMDKCNNYETPYHYYPMVCQAKFNGVDESFYLSNNFTYENGILALKPVFGKYMNWLGSIKRCQKYKSEPFIPRSESDWEWLRIVSSSIDDPLPHNLWLPASDRNVEGILKWVPIEDATHDPFIPWAKNEVMRMNKNKRDCLQLWSGNGHLASMDDCESVYNTLNNYYPMVCKATFRSISTNL